MKKYAIKMLDTNLYMTNKDTLAPFSEAELFDTYENAKKNIDSPMSKQINCTIVEVFLKVK